jgi:hypothetical protein
MRWFCLLFLILVIVLFSCKAFIWFYLVYSREFTLLLWAFLSLL